MRKVILAVMLAIVSCTCAFAQKGVSAAGINLGAGIGLEEGNHSNILIGAKYQYGVTDAIRLEAAFNYGIGMKKDYVKWDVITYGINAHWIVNPESSFKFYPIVGIGGGTCKASVSVPGLSYSDSTTGFMYNIGVGGEYSLSENLALGLEIKFQSILNHGHYNQLPINLGLTYKF